MNLSRVRLQLTALFSVLAAIAIAGIAIAANQMGSNRIYDSAEREAEQIVADVALEEYWAEDFVAHNVWVVNPDTEFVQALGNRDVEPPYFTIAEQARARGANFTEFDQGGAWLGYAREIGEDDVILAAIDLADYRGDAASLRWRLTLAAVGAIALIVVAGYWLAGRSLTPARAAMEQQRHFIADAAHELRTPLAVIQASASQALSRERDADAYKVSLFEIQQAAQRAGTSVAELLELARLEAGTSPPRTSPLRLDLLIEEIASTMESSEGARVKAELGEPIVIEADHGLLRQAIDNVATNAAARSTMVTITARREDSTAIIEVSDDGPGFADGMLPHVFQRFRRGDEKGSAGLGMSIVRTIIEAHDGHCEAQNQPDGGAVVRLSLPA